MYTSSRMVGQGLDTTASFPNHPLPKDKYKKIVMVIRREFEKETNDEAIAFVFMVKEVLKEFKC